MILGWGDYPIAYLPQMFWSWRGQYDIFSVKNAAENAPFEKVFTFPYLIIKKTLLVFFFEPKVLHLEHKIKLPTSQVRDRGHICEAQIDTF